MRAGGLKKCAELADVTAEQVGRWRDGKSKAPFVAVAKIVSASGLRLDWLLSGDERDASVRERMEPTIDPELMGRITEAIFRLYEEERAFLRPLDLGRLVAAKYCEISAAADDPGERTAMIKLIVTQLRNELRAAARMAASNAPA